MNRVLMWTAEVLSLGALLMGCSGFARHEQTAVTQLTNGGNAKVGAEVIRRYGCQTCHTIRGVPGARGLVGPELNGIRERSYIAGQLPNTPDNLTRWIQHPHTVNPRTVMPEMNVSEEDGRNIAAYLYTLR